MKKVLLTGANGFVGYWLIEKLVDAGMDVLATGRGKTSTSSRVKYAQMDFTDPFALHDVFEEFQPDVVIHAGAISRPDDCERDQWQAFVTNVEGTVHLLTNAAEYKSHFIFLSTDFVFDGEKGMYVEEDMPRPINYYGQTKLEAEEAVIEYEHKWSIVRTVSVYGRPLPGKMNLISIVNQKLQNGEAYRVVDDQWRTPTHVEDLAAGIVLIVLQESAGVFHLAGADQTTPYRMAMMMAEILKLDGGKISRATAADFVEPAKRPLLTGLDITKARKELGYQPRALEEGLRLSLLGINESK
jgi:dTDP-4-dehydrorhamnose reductase